MVFQASTDTYAARPLQRNRISLMLLALATLVLGPVYNSFAQYQENNFVDSFDNVDATAADFHNDKFR
jgi:hypothetical protein